jgi:hypothetical protein
LLLGHWVNLRTSTTPEFTLTFGAFPTISTLQLETPCLQVNGANSICYWKPGRMPWWVIIIYMYIYRSCIFQHIKCALGGPGPLWVAASLVWPMEITWCNWHWGCHQVGPCTPSPLDLLFPTCPLPHFPQPKYSPRNNPHPPPPPRGKPQPQRSPLSYQGSIQPQCIYVLFTMENTKP